MNNKRFSRPGRVLAAGLLLLLLGLSVWKLPRSMATPDEALYLSIPYRLLQGDRPLLHEWHVTQLASLLLLPLLRLRLWLAGGSAGVLLAFRRLYLALHTLTALYLWRRLRPLSRPAGVTAAALYLVFVPFNVPALSYNTMGLGLLCAALVTLALGEGKPWAAWVSGLCFGAAVLCNPYFFLLYLVYLAAALIARLRKKKGYAQLGRGFVLRLTGGGALAALYALILVFRRTDLSLLRETLPAVILGDTAEHPARSLFGVLYGMWVSFGKNRLFLPTLAVSVLLVVLKPLDKNWRAHRAAYLAVAALLSMAYGLWFRRFLHISLNFYMFPLSILGFFAWYYGDGRRNGLFWFVYFPGVLCWLCSAMASNLGFLNIASVSTINMLASVVFLYDAALPLWRGGGARRCAAAGMLLAAAVQFGLLAECRFTTIYPMEPVAAATEKIDCGALKGLLVRPEEKARYEEAFALSAPVREASGGTVAYFTEIPGQYLDDDKRCAVYSAWFPSVSVPENLPRLRLYWALFPERVPTHIVLGMDDPAANALLEEALSDWGIAPEDFLRLPAAD